MDATTGSSSSPSRRQPTIKTKRAPNLQTWLVVLIVLISSLGLAASAFAVTTVMRSVLINRVDDSLYTSIGGWTQNEALYETRRLSTPPSDFVVLAVDPNGWMRWAEAYGDRPDLSSVVIDGPPVTVQSAPGSVEQRAWRALGKRNENGGVTFVAKSLRSEEVMINGLIAVQVVISIIVLLLIALVGAFTVKHAVRPLREVEATARAIAGGDLDRRVPQWPEHTEVGQLATSLNTMLGRLQDSIETLQEKEEQMRRFIGDASHELRTPLTSVRGYTELYRSGATDDVDKVLDKVDEESGRMKLLVEDLLALTRAEGKRLDMRPVDLLEVALSVRTSAMAAFPGRTIEVENVTDQVPLVNGDPDRLHQVLLNLISNGLRHGGEAATVAIRLRDDGHSVILDVADDGVGMPVEVSTHIFERFYRADSSRTRGAGGGSGLGLSIVKALVEQHGGTIAVKSQEGVGSTFTITLPRLLNPENTQR